MAINDANRVVFTLVENPVGTFTATLTLWINRPFTGRSGGTDELTNLSLAGVYTATTLTPIRW